MSIHVDLSQVIHTLKCSVSNNIPINFCVLFYKRKIAFTIRYTPFNLHLSWKRFFRLPLPIESQVISSHLKWTCSYGRCSLMSKVEVDADSRAGWATARTFYKWKKAPCTG